MVTNVTSLTRSGLADFVLQRASAAILALYSLCVLGFFLVTPDLTYAQFTDYFHSMTMRTFSTLAVLAFTGHVWVGMWTIGTDYLREAHVGGSATSFRLAYQALCIAVIFVFVVWGLQIIWR